MLFCGAERWGGGVICGAGVGQWGGEGVLWGGLWMLEAAVGLKPPQHVLLTLSYPELSWELVGAVGQDGDAAEGLGGADAAEPPQLWLEFDGEQEGARVNRLLRVLSPQVCLLRGLLGGLGVCPGGGGWEGHSSPLGGHLGGSVLS